MKSFGVIGYPLEHSLSKSYFENKFLNENIKDVEYLNFECQNLDELFNSDKILKLEGFNITAPYKESIITFLDKLSHEAEQTQSVNTIIFDNGDLIGHNTDIAGFELSIRHHKVDVKNKKILILGSGGVVPSIIIALQKLNVAKIYMMNRTREKAEKLSKRFKNLTVLNWGEKCDFELIINATSVGINKNEDLKLEFNHLPPNRIFYDVIYNPEETLFLKNAKANLHRNINGKMMFIYQAHQSFTIWHKVMPKIDDDTISKIKI